uniref:Ure2p6 n=1 Tax=Exophiala pisciphila TaxID=86051 RepID=A0A077D485_9EURO|nr:Ure2p6 [Exophiala pisciphila]
MASQPPYHQLTYYTFGTPNGLKPAIVLEELGLKYNVEKVDITKNAQKEEWYLAINPNGRIPALLDGNDIRIFESGAIMLYLVENYDNENVLGYPRGGRNYYEVLSWLMWQMGGLGPMQGQANHFRAMASAYSEYGITRYMGETKRLFDVLESRLRHADWLAGDKYTIADIASYAWVRAAPGLLGIELHQWPGIERWFKRIGDRTAVKKAQNVPEGAMTEEDMRLMGESMRTKVDSMKDAPRDSR